MLDTTGLLIVGHGTRDRLGSEQFLDVVDQSRRRMSPLAIEPGLLEFAQPTIGEGFARLVERGCRRVCVVPLLLFAAGHVRRDIPAAVAAAASGFPGTSVLMAGHLGCGGPMLQLSRGRYAETVAAAAPVPEEDTVLVFVGRGSYDPAATAEMARFVELRQRGTRFAKVISCVLAMAQPRLAEALRQAASIPCRRVVVQPHLLFAGSLVDETRALVADAAASSTAEWLVIPPLGPSPLLTDAVLASWRSAQRRWRTAPAGRA